MSFSHSTQQCIHICIMCWHVKDNQYAHIDSQYWIDVIDISAFTQYKYLYFIEIVWYSFDIMDVYVDVKASTFRLWGLQQRLEHLAYWLLVRLVFRKCHFLPKQEWGKHKWWRETMRKMSQKRVSMSVCPVLSATNPSPWFRVPASSSLQVPSSVAGVAALHLKAFPAGSRICQG